MNTMHLFLSMIFLAVCFHNFESFDFKATDRSFGGKTNTHNYDEKIQTIQQACKLLVASVALMSTPIFPVQAERAPLPILQCSASKCGGELSYCLRSPRCVAGLGCIAYCNNRADEADCEMNCLNYFEDSAMKSFSICLFDKDCVEKRADDGRYPFLMPDQYVKTFDMRNFEGEWFVAAGLNPCFEGFDCQKHTFKAPRNKGPGGAMFGALNYRITEPFGNFFTRSQIKRFEQDPQEPGIIRNFLGYLNMVDTWYILDYKTDEYILVYYRGDSDAWEGYGGATLYTRTGKLPAGSAELQAIEQACMKAGIAFSDFQPIDNSCQGQDSIDIS